MFEIPVESLETPALTKAQLADMLFEQIGLNKRESKDMIDAFFEVISQRLIAGEDVKLAGFGNFQIRIKAPRPGRNPRTGELIPIAARRVANFMPCSRPTFSDPHRLSVGALSQQSPLRLIEPRIP